MVDSWRESNHMQLIKKKPFDPDNPQDVLDRVDRMKPRSFTDEEIVAYLQVLNCARTIRGGEDEAISVLREEQSKRKT